MENLPLILIGVGLVLLLGIRIADRRSTRHNDDLLDIPEDMQVNDDINQDDTVDPLFASDDLQTPSWGGNAERRSSAKASQTTRPARLKTPVLAEPPVIHPDPMVEIAEPTAKDMAEVENDLDDSLQNGDNFDPLFDDIELGYDEVEDDIDDVNQHEIRQMAERERSAAERMAAITARLPMNRKKSPSTQDPLDFDQQFEVEDDPLLDYEINGELPSGHSPITQHDTRNVSPQNYDQYQQVHEEDREPRILTLYVAAPAGHVLDGERVKALFAHRNYQYGKHKIFHSFHKGKVIFSVANMVEPGYFELSGMNSMETPGIALFACLPGPLKDDVTFDILLSEAYELAIQLNADLLDESRSTLTKQTMHHMREELLIDARIRETKRAKLSERAINSKKKSPFKKKSFRKDKPKV